MLNNSDLLKKIASIILATTLFSIFYNQFRLNPLPLLKKELEIISEVHNVDGLTAEPSISGIDINLAQKLFENGMMFIDARAEEYFFEGHIPGAICSDDFDSLTQKLEDLISMDDSFVVYCGDDDCGSSEDLAYELQAYGFNNIYLFKGGWKEWQNSDLPEEK